MAETISIEVSLSREKFEQLLDCCDVEGGPVEKVAGEILSAGIAAHCANARRVDEHCPAAPPAPNR